MVPSPSIAHTLRIVVIDKIIIKTSQHPKYQEFCILGRRSTTKPTKHNTKVYFHFESYVYVHVDISFFLWSQLYLPGQEAECERKHMIGRKNWLHSTVLSTEL
jgi:hypothetical protein